MLFASSPSAMGGFSSILASLLLLSTLAPTVHADGNGLIGLGKWMYRPVCGHSCRRLIANNPLLCDSKLPGDKPSEDHSSHTPTRRHLHGSKTTPECYMKDAAYLRTMALCMAEQCPKEADPVPLSVIEEYWEGHLATGSVADHTWTPIMTYSEALRYAHADVEANGEGNTPYTSEGAPLNVTSLVRSEDLTRYINAQNWFEQVETDHSRNSLAVAVTSVMIPILFSLPRLLPGKRPLWYSRIEATLAKPLMGHRHRTPVVANQGIMPTRGQSLYILYLIVTQIVLAILPIYFVFPNSIGPTKRDHYLVVIGNRSGALAMADFLALFLFSSRNNILLRLTNWSHSTFLLLHRWIAYCMIFQACMHSALLLASYYEDHASESQMPYWIWGIVATLLFVVMWPLSILPVRQKAYEFFLVSHQVLAALGLVATFFHIYKLFKYNWGYEIWVYIGGGVWFLDRAIRFVRLVAGGWRTAVVTVIPGDSADGVEYLKVEVEGVVAHGHAYLYFPTLSWRVWENHPYSLLSTFHHPYDGARNSSKAVSEKEEEDSGSSTGSSTSLSRRGGPHATFLIRPMSGLTKILSSRLLATSNRRLTLPVIVEASYHSNPSIRDLKYCQSLLCIAGGVGITGVLEAANTFGGTRVRVVWGVRNAGLVKAAEAEISALRAKGAIVDISIGERVKVADVLKEELAAGGIQGDLGVVVCGPDGMADDVRAAVVDQAGKVDKGIVFVDEAFSW